jgi:hypothetical protein
MSTPPVPLTCDPRWICGDYIGTVGGGSNGLESVRANDLAHNHGSAYRLEAQRESRCEPEDKPIQEGSDFLAGVTVRSEEDQPKKENVVRIDDGNADFSLRAVTPDRIQKRSQFVTVPVPNTTKKARGRRVPTVPLKYASFIGSRRIRLTISTL